jgi:hypothetical protein
MEFWQFFLLYFASFIHYKIENSASEHKRLIKWVPEILGKILWKTWKCETWWYVCDTWNSHVYFIGLAYFFNLNFAESYGRWCGFYMDGAHVIIADADARTWNHILRQAPVITTTTIAIHAIWNGPRLKNCHSYRGWTIVHLLVWGS